METHISKRFKEVVEHLLHTNKVKNQTLLGKMVGSDGSYIGQMMKGSTVVSIKTIQLLLDEFGVSANYILSGIGTMYIDRIDESNRTQLLSEPLAVYGAKNEIIQSLKEQLKAL
jgi:transcriptional regulator with XRE-family HTH domain